MAGFRKGPAQGQPSNNPQYTQRAPSSGGSNYKRGSSKPEGNPDSSRIAGLFRHEGKNGVFWSSPIMEDGYRYTLNLNPKYEEDPSRFNEFVLRKVKVPDEVLNRK